MNGMSYRRSNNQSGLAEESRRLMMEKENDRDLEMLGQQVDDLKAVW